MADLTAARVRELAGYSWKTGRDEDDAITALRAYADVLAAVEAAPESPEVVAHTALAGEPPVGIMRVAAVTAAIHAERTRHEALRAENERLKREHHAICDPRNCAVHKEFCTDPLRAELEEARAALKPALEGAFANIAEAEFLKMEAELRRRRDLDEQLVQVLRLVANNDVERRRRTLAAEAGELLKKLEAIRG